jgi:hypothetical protein
MVMRFLFNGRKEASITLCEEVDWNVFRELCVEGGPGEKHVGH